MLRRIEDMPAGTIGFEAIGEVEGDALGADARFRARHPSSFERLAVVGDEDWMGPALATLSFLLPGRAKAFRNSEMATAKAWLIAG